MADEERLRKRLYAMLKHRPSEQDRNDPDKLAFCYLLDFRWPSGGACPTCDEQHDITFASSSHRWSCRRCGTSFSIRTDTILEGSRLSLITWLRAFWLIAIKSDSVDCSDFVRELSVVPKTADYMLYRIRSVLPQLGSEYDYQSSICTDQNNESKFQAILGRIFNPKRNSFISLRKGPFLKKLEELEKESVHLVIASLPITKSFASTYDPYLGFERPAWDDESAYFNYDIIDPGQFRTAETLSNNLGNAILPSMVPGAFMILFGQPEHLYHIRKGLTEAGLKVTDSLVWLNTSTEQTYVPVEENLVDRMNIFPSEKKQLLRRLRKLRRPNSESIFSLIVLAQKPFEGNVVENWLRHRTGLVNVNASLLESISSTLIALEKPREVEKECNLIRRPLKLFEQLIKLYSSPGQVVLDPSAGQGTIAIAALRAGRAYIGFESDPNHIIAANERIEKAKQDYERA